MRCGRRQRHRGFTLVELMVSLVAGLLIAIAVVALGRTSTLAFHEQARLMQTEQSLRSAADRLRNDLTRASFMGTGNALLSCFDAECRPAPPPGRIPLGHRTAYVNGQNPLRYAGMNDLQGIRIAVQGSLGATNPYSATNGLAPDSLFLTGNMTTDDQYVGTVIGNGACGGPRIRILAIADPANERLLNNAPSAAIATQYMQNAFTPVNGVLFFARVTDKQGCQHHVYVQNANAPAPNIGEIDVCTDAGGVGLVPRGSVVNGTGSPNCGWGGGQEEVIISPLHRVNWRIAPASTVQPRILPLPGADLPASHFVLVRELRDALGAALPGPPAGPLPQIVAEYVVDLKFGVVVENYVPPPNNISVFDVDSDPGGGSISTWTQPIFNTLYGQPGPQRVRSVRFRLAVRTPQPDRKAPLAEPAPYILRYCVDPARGCPPADLQDRNTRPNYARVRTIHSEVALINQARMNY